MATIYKTLHTTTLSEDAPLDRPQQVMARAVKLSDPATSVVTDLSRVAAITIDPFASLDDANARMIAAGVRLLFVTDQAARVVGIITSRDLAGDRAINYVKEHGGTRADITVRDIMTPRLKIEVLDGAEIEKARVGDIVETLKRMGRQHALVIRKTGEGRSRITGVISSTQISKQTGEDFSTAGVAGSMAELAART
ncbi:MAG: hypothetical protein RLZ44_403 [Pseudomonadota bacterium]